MPLFDLVSRRVQARNLHRDEKSLDAITGHIKPKYKLAGNPIRELDSFVFFVCAGSHPGAYYQKILVKIKDSEWLNIVTGWRFGLETSCIEVTKHEVLTSREVGIKIADPQNGFKYVAQLPEPKFQELQDSLFRLKSVKKPPSEETTRLIASALDIAPEIMKKLGI